MNPILKFLLLLAILCLSGYGLWHAIKGSIAKRPVKKRATLVYAIWLLSMVAGMIVVHPAMLLLPLLILGPLYLLKDLLPSWPFRPRNEGTLRLVFEDIHDMGINALFTGVFVFVVYFVAYAFYPEHLG